MADDGQTIFGTPTARRPHNTVSNQHPPTNFHQQQLHRISTMEEDPQKSRKARIAALRTKAGRAAKDSIGGETTDEQPPHPPVLQVVALTNSVQVQAKKKQKGAPSKENQGESALILALRQAQAEANTPSAATDGIADLTHKKINADLKREIQPKLQKLERRTQKALVALLRERLEREAAAEIDE